MKALIDLIRGLRPVEVLGNEMSLPLSEEKLGLDDDSDSLADSDSDEDQEVKKKAQAKEKEKAVRSKA